MGHTSVCSHTYTSRQEYLLLALYQHLWTRVFAPSYVSIPADKSICSQPCIITCRQEFLFPALYRYLRRRVFVLSLVSILADSSMYVFFPSSVFVPRSVSLPAERVFVPIPVSIPAYTSIFVLSLFSLPADKSFFSQSCINPFG
jgi:hypothetical protein